MNNSVKWTAKLFVTGSNKSSYIFKTFKGLRFTRQTAKSVLTITEVLSLNIYCKYYLQVIVRTNIHKYTNTQADLVHRMLSINYKDQSDPG